MQQLTQKEQAMLCDALTRQHGRWETFQRLMMSEGKPTPPDAREALRELSGLIKKLEQPTS